MRLLAGLCFLHAFVGVIAASPGLAAGAEAASSPVKVWQDTIDLPTYPEGLPPEDPPFLITRPDSPVYPYTLRTNLGTASEKQTWRAIHLENEFLACSFLPDLGGHLYRCIDKANNHDVFHPALSIKKQAIAPRGAWVSTGIELNFPIGHSWDTVSPVDFHWQTNSDGSGSVFVSDRDKVEQMQWLVEFSLRPGSRVLEQAVTLYNPSQLRQRYFWWANAAVTVESPDTTFIYPTYLMYPDDGSKNTVPWPRSRDGADLTKQGKSKDKLGLFAAESREPFMGVFNPASKTGVVHYADPASVPGKKLWNWGTDTDGWVRKNFSDDGSTYVELQAGVFKTAGDFDFLEPQQVKRFTEYWIPVHEMDGITRATLDAVLNFERRDQSIVIQIQANRQIGAATIRVTSGSEKLLEEPANLTMQAVYSKTVQARDKNPVTVEVLDAQGKSLLRHTEGVYDAEKSIKAAASIDTNFRTRDGALAEAAHNERIGALPWARNTYERGVNDFGTPALIKGLARLNVMQAHFSDAIRLYSRVSFGGEPLDAESEYYWGIALHYTGDQTTAQRHWKIAMQNPAFAAAARLELAYDLAMQQKWDEALKMLAPLDAISKRMTRVGELEVMTLRRAGRKGEAAEHLTKWLAIDPTDSVLRNEATLLAKDDAALWQHLGADADRVLSVVDVYFRAGDFAAALTLLERNYPTVPSNEMEPGTVPPQQNPLIGYYRGYCRQQLGKSGAEDYAAASKMSVKYVYPSRFSSLAVLRAATRATPSDGTAHYLLGSLDLHFALVYGAIEEFRAAVRANFREPVVYWSLAKGMSVLRDDFNALVALKEAERVGPLPPDLQQLSTKLSASLSKTKRGNAVARAIPVSLPPPSATKAVPAEAKPKVDPATQTPDELARTVFDDLTDTEVEAASSAMKQERLKQISSNDLLHQAYYETMLQKALFTARKRQCDDIEAAVRQASEADPQFPFTKPGGKTVLESPRFLFYLGRAYGLCGKPEQAQNLWKQSANAKREITAPDYVFPVLSRVQLGAMHGKPVKPDLEKALSDVNEKLPSASKKEQPALNYSAAMLLQALGRLSEAEAFFHAAAEGDIQVGYTARLGLRDNELARHGVK